MRYNGVWVTPEPKITGLKSGGVSVRLRDETLEILKQKKWNDRLSVFPPDDFSYRSLSPDEVELTADMTPKAKVIDFMSFGPFMFPTDIIISQRAADFLASQKMLKYELVSITLYNNKEKVPGKFYFWINHALRPELFELEQAIIRSGTIGLGFKFHQVNDISAYREFIKEFNNTTFIRTKLKDPVPAPGCLEILADAIFVTEKFWKEYEQAKLIGLKLIKKELELVE
ncbi:hypothetical protein AAHN97_11470 [Chitinophaga niabensis]|uniref:hypothetical protein n=1 Tax=Chitinophaga niabensis TaxID=536979 RepID=UPI0031BAD6FE